jgi:hypothetical protein
LLQEFADIYIVDQKTEELYSDQKQKVLTAKYVLGKALDLEHENIVLNTCYFYGIDLLSKSAIDDRRYFDQKDLERMPLMKNLRELSLQDYFNIESVIYKTKDLMIYPHTVKIMLSSAQAKSLDNDLIKKIKKPIRKIIDKNELKFYSETGEIAFKNELGEVLSGSKGAALLIVLGQNKNTTFNIEEVMDFCNPLVSNPAHAFKAEKDVTDTIRLIKSKLKVGNNAFFPIEKKGSKNTKQWIWTEK